MFCENCGAKINEKDEFCSECGRPTTPTERLRQFHTEISKKSEYPMWKGRWAILGIVIALIIGGFLGNWFQASYSIELERQWLAGADAIISRMSEIIEKDGLIIANSEKIKSKISDSYECILDYDYWCAETAINDAMRLEGQQDVLYSEVDKLLKELEQLYNEQKQLDNNIQQI